jgi:glucosamine--fructose-6-phosphate aminotransferase (isomerizing)
VSLWSEIGEQPEVLAHVCRERAASAAEVAAILRGGDVRSVLIAARGTSDDAARYAQYLWGARNRLLVGLAAPSLFTTYASPPSLEGAVVLAISQSGRSPDLVAVLEEARAQSRPTAALTNDPGSPLARAAEHVFDLGAGPELAVAATKTYTAQLGAVAAISAALAEDRAMTETLARVPDTVATLLEGADSVRDAATAFGGAERAAVLGRGYNFSTAHEWALKLQELAVVAALPFSPADFEHGPIALVERGFPVFAVVPDGPFQPGLTRLLGRLVERGADVLAVRDPRAHLEPEIGVVDLPPDVPEWISPIPAIVAAQLLTYGLTFAKGLDPDAPRGLGKVTETW